MNPIRSANLTTPNRFHRRDSDRRTDLVASVANRLADLSLAVRSFVGRSSARRPEHSRLASWIVGSLNLRLKAGRLVVGYSRLVGCPRFGCSGRGVIVANRCDSIAPIGSADCYRTTNRPHPIDALHSERFVAVP